jgi:hypothetical protein
LDKRIARRPLLSSGVRPPPRGVRGRARIGAMSFPEPTIVKNSPRAARAARALLAAAACAAAACAAAAGCMAPSDITHRVSIDVASSPKDLRACVIEAIRGVDGVQGVDPPAGGEESLVAFRTTLPEVSGEVEREDAGVRVSIEVMQRVEPPNFWAFAQPRAKAIGDAIGARCGAL